MATWLLGGALPAHRTQHWEFRHCTLGDLEGWQGTRALSGWFQGKGVRRPWGPGGPGSKPRSLRLWPRAPCVAPEPA